MQPPSDKSAGQPASGVGLRRVLGANIAIAVVVGNVIGSGIFFKPGAIAQTSGSFLLIIATWICGGLLCLMGGLCFAELGTMYPQAGGPYVYLQRAYGKLAAFLYGWTEMLFVRPASIGALATAFVGSLALAIDRELSITAQVALACTLIAGMTWINILGVVWGARLQLVVTIIKAGFLALVALSPILLAPWAGWMIDVDNYRATPSPSGLSWTAQVGAILIAVMWAYDGWHGVTPLAEEIQNPQRNIPLALVGGLGILIALYVSANVAYHGVLSNAEMAAAKDHAAEQMVFKLAGEQGRTVLSVVILISVFGAINSNLLLAPRVMFAMGRDAVFFRWLGVVHANYRTPVAAILLTGAMAMALVIGVAGGRALVRNWDAEALPSRFAAALVTSLQQATTFSMLTNLVCS